MVIFLFYVFDFFCAFVLTFSSSGIFLTFFFFFHLCLIFLTFRFDMFFDFDFSI